MTWRVSCFLVIWSCSCCNHGKLWWFQSFQTRRITRGFHASIVRFGFYSCMWGVFFLSWLVVQCLVEVSSSELRLSLILFSSSGLCACCVSHKLSPVIGWPGSCRLSHMAWVWTKRFYRVQTWIQQSVCTEVYTFVLVAWLTKTLFLWSLSTHFQGLHHSHQETLYKQINLQGCYLSLWRLHWGQTCECGWWV